MKISSKDLVKKLSPVAEILDEGTITDGVFVTSWFKDYSATYFFKKENRKEELIGISMDYNGQKSFIGRCL